MDAGFALQIFINGLSLSGTYMLAALGLTLVFGVLRIMNFAHGELIMVGGYAVFVLFAERQLPFWIAVVGAMLVVGGLALGIERGLFRLTRAVPFNGLIISLGLVSALQLFTLLLFGPLGKPIPTPIPGQVEIWGASFSIQKLIMLPLIASIIAIVWVLLERTRLGRAVRACIQDNEAAALQGMSVDRMSAMVMFIAGALAGLAGAVIFQTISVEPGVGTYFILRAFIVVIVGGMGSVGGTVVAAFIFGFLDSTTASLLTPRISILMAVGVLFLVLIIRPQGLFGRE